MRHHLPSISRRGMLTAAPLTLVVAGCEWGPESSSSSDTESVAPAPDADRAVVDKAVAAITAVMAVVGAQTAPFGPLHTAHLEHLGAAPAPATESATASAEVRRLERRLRDDLVGLAGTAQSGDLARSLASMAAGIAQLLAGSLTPTGARG